MTHQPVSLATFLLVGAITLTLAACSNDNGGNSGGGHPPAPSAALVYLADQDIEGVDELYLLGSNGTSTKLNPALPVGRSVTRFRITPDKTAVVYRADQDTDDLLELYRVPLATPGVSTKLNGPLASQQKKQFFDFQFTPDSSAVLYTASPLPLFILELYRVPLTTSGVSTRLNGPLVANGDVIDNGKGDFQVTPDGSAVVYLAVQDTVGVIELYRVPLATPGVSTKLNGPLGANGDVYGFQVTPDSSAVVYLANQDAEGVSELYRVSFAAPGVSTKLNGPLGANMDVLDVQVTPDSSAVVYLADQDDATGELYRVSFAAPGVSTKLNSPLAANGHVGDFQFTPDSSAVLYTATPAPLGIPELYRVLLTTPGVSTKLNGPLEGYVQDVHVTPDSSAVVYLANLKTTDSFRLYRASFVAPGVSTELNGPLVANGGSVQKFQVTPDGSAVVYRAVQDTDGVIELYRVPLATPGVSTKLNGPLVAHGGVRDFAFP